MKTKQGKGNARGWLAMIAALAGSGLVAQAEDDTLQLFTTGGTTNVTGQVEVGDTGTNNVLVVSNATVLANTGEARVGDASAARFNVALVEGSGSAWNPGSALRVGISGSFNQLIISNGASITLSGANSTIIGGAATASNNLMLITGTGSFFDNGNDLLIGSSAVGQNNELRIENGGRLDAPNFRIFGTNNTVTIASGGTALTIGVNIGENAGNIGATTLVTGNGSAWTNTGAVIVGVNATQSKLRVEDGGRVVSATLAVGSGATGSNNLMLVRDSGSVAHITGDFTVGSLGTDNLLIITNGGRVNAGQTIVGNSASGARNSVLVTGAGSVLTNVGVLHHGLNSVSNQFTIADGGTVYNTGGRLGSSATSHDNTLLVTGSGSRWINSSDVTVGFGTGSTNNLLMVASDGVVTSSATVVSGGNGHHNQIVVTNGGRIIANQGLLGNIASSSNNTVLITGTGSIWTNNLTMFIGNVGSGNQVTVADGGQLHNGQGIIANTTSSTNNAVLVTGANALWNNRTELFVGHVGQANTLVISNGGTVRTPQTVMGNNASSSNNTLWVTGSGSLLTNSGALFVGNNSLGNRLVISNGGRVINTSATLGNTVGSSNNTAIISGNDSLWLINGALNVGNASRGNQLIVENGGAVTNTGSISIGVGAGASNNVLRVTGTGSAFVQTSGDFVFNGGANNTLIVADGGTVQSLNQRHFSRDTQVIVTNGGFLRSGSISLGNLAGASNSLFVVTGAGSLVTNTGTTALGSSDGSSMVRIENGGEKYALGTTIGGAGTSNSMLFVTGPGSIYRNGDNFNVGSGGSSNHVVIANGGQLITHNIRYFSGPNNDVIVTNGGIVSVVVSVTLGEGATSTGSRLLITNYGSSVTTPSLAAGSATTGDSQVRVLDGALLEANTMSAGSAAGNSISNVGGIYQFTAGPNITPNGVGRIAITDGTISYRNFGSANIHDLNVANIAFAGDNTFRLNNSTNTGVAGYTFNTGLGATNYHRLELVNGGSRWQSANLTIGSGGGLLVSNAANATVAANVVSTGSILVVNSRVTFASNVVINGSYISDPSTNTYLADVTVNQPGSLAGGAGDLFDFKKSFFIHSTNRLDFDLSLSTVQFSGGGVHTNAITGMDLGNGSAGYDASFTLATNFAYGTLRLAATNDIVCFECGTIPTIASYALYVNFLDLTGLTNQIGNVNTLVTSLLRAPTNITIYYQLGGLNSYLGGQTFQLFDCEGDLGGLLVAAIPEPSALLTAALALGILMQRKDSRR